MGTVYRPGAYRPGGGARSPDAAERDAWAQPAARGPAPEAEAGAELDGSRSSSMSLGSPTQYRDDGYAGYPYPEPHLEGALPALPALPAARARRERPPEPHGAGGEPEQWWERQYRQQQHALEQRRHYAGHQQQQHGEGEAEEDPRTAAADEEAYAGYEARPEDEDWDARYPHPYSQWVQQGNLWHRAAPGAAAGEGAAAGGEAAAPGGGRWEEEHQQRGPEHAHEQEEEGAAHDDRWEQRHYAEEGEQQQQEEEHEDEQDGEEQQEEELDEQQREQRLRHQQRDWQRRHWKQQAEHEQEREAEGHGGGERIAAQWHGSEQGHGSEQYAECHMTQSGPRGWPQQHEEDAARQQQPGKQLWPQSPLKQDGGARPKRQRSGMDVTIKGLTYKVRGPGGAKKVLLSDVTGAFEPGKLSTLMGPSGSGKTTLLDILAGRKSAGKLSGEVLFAGIKPTLPFLRRHTGYVEQFDTLLPMLTVEEMLMYTAELKRPRRETRAVKRAAVEDLLETLGLLGCRKVKIGNPEDKGISGGQAKRTNIGIALITNPRVVMLDEPTSGLDSFTANEVISVLKSLSTEGVTIIATVHSPTAYAFSLFDSLLMLVRGRIVYCGASGAAAMEYVNGLPAASWSSPYEPWLSDVEWLVDMFAAAERAGQADALADAYEASQLHEDAVLRVERLESRRRMLSESTASDLAVRTATNTPWWWGLLVLIRYRTLHNYTNLPFLAARLSDKVSMGCTIMTLYWGIGGKFALDNYFNIAAVLFMWCMIPAFGAAAFVPSLVLERRLFVRERHDGLYRVATYLIAKMIDEVGVAAVGSVVISAIVFFGVKLQGAFLVFWLTYFATLCVGISLAYCIAAVSPTMDMANAALPTYVGSLAFVSGFLIRFDDMPPAWRWYARANPLAYSFTALMQNQFREANPKFIGGNTLLQYFGVDNQDIWMNIGIVWGFFGFFAFLTWLILCIRRYERR